MRATSIRSSARVIRSGAIPARSSARVIRNSARVIRSGAIPARSSARVIRSGATSIRKRVEVIRKRVTPVYNSATTILKRATPVYNGARDIRRRARTVRKRAIATYSSRILKKPGPAERRASVKARGQKHRSALSYSPINNFLKAFMSSLRSVLLPFGQAKGRIKRNYQTLRQAQGDKRKKN
jgi:hypothetical protein